MNRHFRKLAREHVPEYRFRGRNREDWKEWREVLLPKVLATLGNFPEPVPPNPETLVEWRVDNLIKSKIVFDVEDGLSAPAYVFRPEDCSNEPLPAILCCHGHHPRGKDAVMGFPDPEHAEGPLNGQDFGLQMAKQGFVTMCIDWRGFGERDDRRKPIFHDITRGGKRDQCNVHFLRAALLGKTMLGLNLHDASVALNYLSEQSFVDPERIGVMGMSLGGTIGTWITLREPRVKAANIICYADRFADFALQAVNFCGSQMTPGLFTLCDVPDLHGLIAPRPLLVEMGTQDPTFRIESATDCHRETEKIYAAAEESEKLWLDLFEGAHLWGANHSVEFFRKYL